jgi:hypothetical protein
MNFPALRYFGHRAWPARNHDGPASRGEKPVTKFCRGASAFSHAATISRGAIRSRKFAGNCSPITRNAMRVPALWSRRSDVRGNLMSSVRKKNEYRRLAAALLDSAVHARDQDDKTRRLAMAQAWRELADRSGQTTGPQPGRTGDHPLVRRLLADHSSDAG